MLRRAAPPGGDTEHRHVCFNWIWVNVKQTSEPGYKTQRMYKHEIHVIWWFNLCAICIYLLLLSINMIIMIIIIIIIVCSAFKGLSIFV